MMTERAEIAEDLFQDTAFTSDGTDDSGESVFPAATTLHPESKSCCAKSEQNGMSFPAIKIFFSIRFSYGVLYQKVLFFCRDFSTLAKKNQKSYDSLLLWLRELSVPGVPLLREFLLSMRRNVCAFRGRQLLLRRQLQAFQAP